MAEEKAKEELAYISENYDILSDIIAAHTTKLIDPEGENNE